MTFEEDLEKLILELNHLAQEHEQNCNDETKNRDVHWAKRMRITMLQEK